MRINPQLVANYLRETENVAKLVGPEKAFDYNVGIMRYEYNFPYDGKQCMFNELTTFFCMIISSNMKNVCVIYFKCSCHR